jgi:hypothetical protein
MYSTRNAGFFVLKIYSLAIVFNIDTQHKDRPMSKSNLPCMYDANFTEILRFRSPWSPASPDVELGILYGTGFVVLMS